MFDSSNIISIRNPDLGSEVLTQSRSQYTSLLVWHLVSALQYRNHPFISGRKTPKLHLFSSHDSMVMPLLVALGCYEWEWPPYAAYISYELYQHKKTNEYYVKIIYNDRVGYASSD